MKDNVKRGIRILAHQDMVSYRRVGALAYRETYPLPPYSTVIGMVHAACGFTSYHPMDVSVQGHVFSTVCDMSTHYNLNQQMKYDASRHQVQVTTKDGSSYGVNRGTMNTELLTDVHLLLHIVPEKEDFDRVLEGLKNPKHFLSLGRYEDLLRIDRVEETDITPIVLEEDEDSLPQTNLYQGYVPLDAIQKGIAQGTHYLLNKSFTIENGFRRWTKKVDTVLASATVDALYDEEGENTFLWKDNQHNFVFLA